MNPLEPLLEKVGRVLSDQFGVKVICEGQRCCTDGKTIRLPALPDNIPDELRDTLRGYLDHEAAHIAAKSDYAIAGEFKKKYGPAGFGFLNALEDLRVEEFMKRRYPGSAVNLDNAFRYAAKVTAEKVEAGDPPPPVKRLAFAVASRAANRPDLPFIDSAAYELAGQLDQTIRAAVTAPDSAVVARLAEAAWPVVEAYLNPIAAGGQGSSKPPGASGGQSPPSAGTGEGSDSLSGGNEPSSKQEKRRRKRKDEGKAPDSGHGGAQASDGAGASGKAGEGDDSGALGIIGGLGGDLSGAVSRHAACTHGYRPWTTANDQIHVVPDYPGGSHAERMRPLLPHVAGVRQRLLQTLMAETRARWLPDQEEGSLNPRALHRIAAARRLNSPKGADALTRRLFRKRVAVQRLKTAVTLLVDLSHSMANHRLPIARNTAMVLCEALSRLNIPVAVWGFSTGNQGQYLRIASEETGIPADELERQFRFAPLVHEVFKRFDEPFRRISGRFEPMRTHLLTPLGESMLFAARELARRPEPRKVLMVLTDGQPSVGLANEAPTIRHAKDNIIRIEKAGIDVVLAGIQTSLVHGLHYRAVNVDKLEDLPGTVMRQLREVLGESGQTATRFPSKMAS